jgi:putative flippase GtrA
MPRMPQWFANRRRFLCFVAVGGTIGILYLGTALLLTNVLHIDVFWANMVAYSCMIPASFWGHKVITYQSVAKAQPEFLRFCFTAALGLLLSMTTIELSNDALHLSPYISIGTVLVVVPMLSYFLMNVWVFSTNRLSRVERE